MTSWKLIKKAKDILEKERGTVYKSWGGKISICLVYPNSYHVGMSNLGFQTIYQCLNSEDDVVCERAFLPDADDYNEYQNSRTPLFSLESQKPLGDFDIVAFSISFENDFINLLSILNLAHFPLRSKDRKESSPLVIAGGVAVFLNPEPISDFFDIFILGEGEEAIKEFLQLYRYFFKERKCIDKEAFFRKAADIEGVYIPRFYFVTYHQDGTIDAMIPEKGFPKKIKRRWIKNLDLFPTKSTLFTSDTEFKGMALIEVNRGCPRGCRFCAAHFVYYPYRNRSLSVLRTIFKESYLDEKRIGLTGTAVSDFPHLIELCRNIISEKATLSLGSLRIDTLNSPLIQCLKEGQEYSIAIAPEAGSERLRMIINKHYREEEILRAIRLLIENGIFQIKCYFLIGLPSETYEDVREIITLTKKIKHHINSTLKGLKGRWSLILSVNPFIPKPSTPFQWLPLEEVSELKKRLKIIQNGIHGDKGIRMIHDLPKWAYIQTLLSKGDRRVGEILIAANNYGDWGKAIREGTLNPDFYVYRKRRLDEVFPWDFIDHGIPKERLIEDYLKAMKEAGLSP